MESGWEQYHITTVLFKNRKKLGSELDLDLRKKLAKCYIWSIAECVAGTSESSTEIQEKF
jgi:REP element-mobilizing transposase RayT